MSHWPDFHLSSSPAALEIPDGSLVQDQLVRREASPGTLSFLGETERFSKNVTLLCLHARSRVKSVENAGMVTMLINARIILVECLYRSSIAAFLNASRRCNCWTFNWRLNHYIVIALFLLLSREW